MKITLDDILKMELEINPQSQPSLIAKIETKDGKNFEVRVNCTIKGENGKLYETIK